MRRLLVPHLAGRLLLAACVLCFGAAGSVRAVTTRALSFDELVQRSPLILHARVLRTDSYWSPTGPLPRVPASGQVKATGSPQSAPSSAPSAVGAPQDVPTRGGSMIFTRVTVDVIEAVKGSAESTMQFVVAGGRVGDRVAWVPGMPRFEAGGEYVIFLRDGYAQAADPITGVRQGIFRVVRDDGGSAVLNADFDYVVAIEDGRLVARLNRRRGQLTGAELPLPVAAEPPLPDAGGPPAVTSPEARRYFSSTEPPMQVESLLDAIRARLAR